MSRRREGLYRGNHVTSLFLDTFPGVLSAFSFRKLISTYSGPSFRVRRDADSAEMNIGFNGTYANTTALTAFLAGGTGKIIAWFDQINGNDVGETSAGKPEVVTVTLGGKTLLAARFTGAESLAGAINTGSIGVNTTTINSVTVNVSGNSTSCIAGTGNYLPGYIRGNYIIGNKYYSIAGGGSSNIDTTIAETVSASLTSTFNKTGTTGAIKGYVNGVLRANSASSPMETYSFTDTTIGSFGSGDFFKGDILEVTRGNAIWDEPAILAHQLNQQEYYGI